MDNEKVSPSTVYVVGVGPGARELITLRASSLIQSADCVAGFHSALAVIAELIRGQTLTLDYSNQEAMVDRIKELSLQGRSCVVCAYGDPNVSDKQLIKKLDSKGVKIEIIPGISSIQAVCARLKLPLEETILVTFHKRGSIEKEKRELLDQIRWGRRSMIVLPRPWDFMPKEIARFLLSEQVDSTTEVTIFQRVTLEDQSMLTCALGELAQTEEAFSDLTILVINKQH